MSLAVLHLTASVRSRRQIGKERQLRFDPCTMQFFPMGQYILMGGSNRECVLYTKEGIKLELIGAQESWVWCAAPRPDSNYVVSGGTRRNTALLYIPPPTTLRMVVSVFGEACEVCLWCEQCVRSMSVV